MIAGLVFIAGAFFSSCAALDQYNRKLNYLPTPGVNGTPESVGLAFQDQWIAAPAAGRTPAGRVHGWWLPQADAHAPTLLYLHGNGGHLSSYIDHLRRLHSLGISVLAIDYRGYGQSTGGLPDEPALYADADAAWVRLLQLAPKAKSYHVYGFSLGGAVAIDLATRAPQLNTLIVDGTFSSAADVGQTVMPKWVPLSLIMTQHFASNKKISTIKVPKLMMHGTSDEVIPFALGQKLFTLAPEPKQWLEVPNATHTEVASMGQTHWEKAVREVIFNQITR
jgi:uncharacterized protein